MGQKIALYNFQKPDFAYKSHTTQKYGMKF